MALYCFTFPIADYEGDKSFRKDIYFQADKCPTHSEVIKAIKQANKEEIQVLKKRAKREGVCDYRVYYFGCTNEYEACLQAIEKISNYNGNKKRKLPILYGNLVQTNVFCDTEFGLMPLTVKRIDPIKIK